MSVPRITQILEGEIQARLDSKDEATREAAIASYFLSATLRELTKIRTILEIETGTELGDEDLGEE